MMYYSIRVALLRDPATIISNMDVERNTLIGAQQTAATRFTTQNIILADLNIYRTRTTVLVRQQPEHEWRLACWRDGPGRWKYPDTDWDIA